MAIGAAAGMTRRSSGTDSGTDNCRDDAQDTATDKNTRGRQTAADERTCGRGNGNAGKVRGGAFGENLGQYRVPQPHARNESKREKHLRHVTYLEVHKKGFQTMTQRITDA